MHLLVTIITFSGLYWLGQPEATLLNVGTLFISFYHKYHCFIGNISTHNFDNYFIKNDANDELNYASAFLI